MDDIDVYLEPARAFLLEAFALLPKALVALLVVLAGWIVAKLVRFAVARALRAMNFHVVTERAGLDGFLRDGGVQSGTTGILAQLFFWLVVLAAFVAAFNYLGLVYLTELLGRVVLFVPRIMLAFLILAFGGYFARFIGNAVAA